VDRLPAMLVLCVPSFAAITHLRHGHKVSPNFLYVRCVVLVTMALDCIDVNVHNLL